MGAGEFLRDALEGRGPAWPERLRDALSGAPEWMGETSLPEGRWEGWAVEAEQAVGALAEQHHPDRIRCAAIAVCAARRMYPPAAQPSGAGRLARWLAHAVGMRADTVEGAVALARYAHLPAADASPNVLREASLETDTRELSALASLCGLVVRPGRFEEACRRAGCWGRRFDVPHLPELMPSQTRRMVLQAVLEGTCATEAEVASLVSACPERRGGLLIAAVGIPASGKTTFLDRHLGDVLTVSMDRMRGALLGDISDQSRNELIHQQSMVALSHALEGGQRVLFDATSTTRDRRAPFLQVARRTGARVLLVYFDVSLDEALRRNESRARQVPDGVIRDAYRHLEAPRPDEADAVLIVSPGWTGPHLWLFERDQWLWEARPTDDIRSAVEGQL